MNIEIERCLATLELELTMMAAHTSAVEKTVEAQELEIIELDNIVVTLVEALRRVHAIDHTDPDVGDVGWARAAYEMRRIAKEALEWEKINNSANFATDMNLRKSLDRSEG